MHLKTLTIKGFKSFASSTTLRLEPGITAVVGPNGSGKSNVVDALTWVMGEQGAKNLRGGSMADVIFAGAGSRPALGRAEVSLTIDNSDGALPIDYTEVTISRTLFRGGGSEYHINGTQCRLLDVQELLSDTGLGRQMHSIVGQGQLDAVLSATPEDRRGFIEEAAGVLKHRKRKERALRKLESMSADLARVADLAQELRRQLGPLARQAAVARRARTIQVEVRDASARLLADDVVQAQSLLEAGQEDSAVLDRRRAEAQEAEAGARARLAALAQDEAACAQRLSRSAEVWQDLTGAAQSLAALEQVAAERVRLLASATAPPRGTDPAELERRAQEAAREEDDLAQAVQEAGAALEQAERRRSDAEAAEARTEQQLAALQRQAAEHRETLARAGGRLASARSRHEASQAALDHARASLEAAQERQARAEAELAQAQHDQSGGAAEDGAVPDPGSRGEPESGTDSGTGPQTRGAAGAGLAAAQAAAAHERATAEVARARQAVSQATDARREAASERATWTARRDTLALSLRSQDGTEALLEAGIGGVLGPLAEHIEVERGWENAVAALLRDLAGAGLAQDASTAYAALERSREEDMGAVSLVLAAGDLPPGPPAPAGEPPVPGSRPAAGLVTAAGRGLAQVLAHLLAGAWVVEDMEAARALRERVPSAVVATRAGDVLAPGWVAGAGRGASSILELAAAHEEAQAQAQAAAHAEAQADEELVRARQAEEAARQYLGEALTALRRADAEAARAAETIARLTSAAHAAGQETERAQRVLERARDEAATRTAELAAATTALAEIEDRQDGQGQQADGALEEAGPARQEAAAAARQARSQETEARLALRTAEERERSHRGRADSLRAAARREREARLAAERAAAQRSAQLEVAAQVRDRARAAAQVADDSARQAAEERRAAQDERTRVAVETSGAREEIDALVKELAMLTDAAHREEVARAEQRMRLEALAERAMSELGVEIEALVEEYGPHMPVPDVVDAPDEHPGDVGGRGAERQRSGRPDDRPDEQPGGPAEQRQAGEGSARGAGRPYVRAEQEKRLARATRDLARLGRVNPLALEEHAALEQRHQFLAEQLADLKRSRDDLLSIVEEVDARVQEAFALAFQDTAREFAGVFDRLFPGGQGRLVLTDPQDMLTTGIEIEARPAGKKVKRLSLLSGGERSLAAVALLVAIFKARPSPFYVMDEVEAALDDTNLGRLLEIFTELRASSQLIIITHQKRTMEVADALYGITMREGITKAVSQRLARQ
ncbi:chromosome segregation protein SMC [Actinomyces bowdenii]|uniref:Chromosome partition protein Smc n=1 Tax=Actinomyces bowdenii TaxID=131109 RepID=A0A853EL75_9ACTO|nr:chromosome segregation protein SMC [Actinomyces bowdenii]MBF0696423.1 chromosome segregation protein SMC [Actinomyces bowdenii]NYS68596.1 chromosome segregation protein SMC [Actinomyces bowdenii]